MEAMTEVVHQQDRQRLSTTLCTPVHSSYVRPCTRSLQLMVVRSCSAEYSTIFLITMREPKTL